MLAAFLATWLFAVSVIAANRSARAMGAVRANFWRLVVAAVLLGMWAHGRGIGLTGEALPWFLLSGLVGFGFGDLALFLALPRLGSRLTVMLTQCLAAPLGALVEWAWLGMGLSGGEVLCGVLVLAGVGTALAPGAGPRGHSGSVVAGTALGVMAAAGQGIGAVLSRKAFMVAELATENVDGITAAYQRIVGGLVLAGLALWFAGRARGEPRGQVGPRPGPAQRYPWRTGVLWVGLNAVAGPALGVSCYQWALKTSPTGIVLAIVATTPLVVIPFAHYWEGERQTRRGLAGCAVAVAGTVGLVLAR